MFLIKHSGTDVPIPFYLTHGNFVKNWIIESNGIKHLQFDHYLFYIPQSNQQDAIIQFIPNIDEIIESGLMMKKSKTRASIFSIDNHSYFGKAIWLSKTSWYKQLRYYFAPPRSFWAACVAKQVEKAGLPTPRVLAVGESRSTGRLITSYLITEATNYSSGLNYVFSSIENIDDLTHLFEKIAYSIYKLHDSGIAHEDLKIDNIFLKQDEVGFWDLDPCLLFNHPVSAKYRIKEYDVFLRSAKANLQKNNHIRFNNDLFAELTKILIHPLLKIDSNGYKKLLSKFSG